MDFLQNILKFVSFRLFVIAGGFKMLRFFKCVARQDPFSLMIRRQQQIQIGRDGRFNTDAERIVLFGCTAGIPQIRVRILRNNDFSVGKILF